MSNFDPTKIAIQTDPLKRRMVGIARHGNTPFDVPFISKVAHNLYQGGCETGMVLPDRIRHVVSLCPWERYELKRQMLSELYVQMYDSEDQGFDQVDQLARWINVCRKTGPVLVHCQAGLNRSSLVVARAIYRDAAIPGAEVIDVLRQKRSPAVLCNPAFESEVRSWK